MTDQIDPREIEFQENYDSVTGLVRLEVTHHGREVATITAPMIQYLRGVRDTREHNETFREQATVLAIQHTIADALNDPAISSSVMVRHD